MTDTEITDTASESAEMAAFRQRARAFLAEHAPVRQRRPGAHDRLGPAALNELASAKQYQAALFDARLAGLTWPLPWSQGLTSEHTRVFNEEAGSRDLPTAIYTIGLGMVIPTLIEFGTEAQKERCVAQALRGEEVWSQLFSEPGAGSDVASLQTKAERDGEEWVLHQGRRCGPGAQLSDFGAVIARTNVDRTSARI